MTAARLAIVPDPPTLESLLADERAAEQALAGIRAEIHAHCQRYSVANGYGVTLRPDQVLRAEMAKGRG